MLQFQDFYIIFDVLNLSPLPPNKVSLCNPCWPIFYLDLAGSQTHKYLAVSASPVWRLEESATTSSFVGSEKAVTQCVLLTWTSYIKDPTQYLHHMGGAKLRGKQNNADSLHSFLPLDVYTVLRLLP